MSRSRAFVLRAVLGVFIVLSASLAQGKDLPSELKYLETLSGDPIALVDAARRFQLQQVAMMDWDQKLTEEYSRDQQPALAQTQQKEMQRRAVQIRAAWEWVLELYPNDARANNYFGEYLFDYAGDEAGGLKHWMTAAQLDSDLGAAQNNLGIYYFHTGEYSRGLEHLQHALKLEPDNPDYLYNMAQMYLVHFTQIERITETPRDKLYRQAMDMSRKAADLAPQDFDVVQDYAVNFFAAENFGVEADWDAAVRAWQKTKAVARTEDERFYSLLNEARARMNGGDSKGAIAPLEEAIALKQDSPAAEQLLAKARKAP